MLVWLGDFNYRVDAEYGEAKGLVRRNDLAPLLAKVPQPTLRHSLGLLRSPEIPSRYKSQMYLLGLQRAQVLVAVELCR